MRVALIQHPSIKLDMAHTGGIEVVELNQLRVLRDRGISANLYVASLTHEQEGLHRIPAPGWQRRYAESLYYLRCGFHERSADVLHGHYTPMLPLWYPTKSVVHFHGLAVSECPLYRSKTAQRRYHSGHYVFCARWLVEGFLERNPGIPDEKLHVIYNGVDETAFTPGPKLSGRNKPVIVFYAGWLPSKGIYELLQAIEIIEQQRSDFEVLFGGSAYSHYQRPESPEIDARVREHAANLRTVRLIGHIRHADLPILLKKCDIGCVPSVYEDPFPLVPLEMMSAGLPVVAFAVGGLKESIIDGETGLLVENRNVKALARALEKLIDNEQLRLAMGEKARKRVEQYFTWDRHVDQLLEIYEQIIKRNRDRKR